MVHDMEASTKVIPQSKHLQLSIVVFLFLCILLLCLKISGLKNSLKGVVPGPRQYLLGSWLNCWDLLEQKVKNYATCVVRNWCAGVPSSVLNLGLEPFSVMLLLTPESIQKIYGSGDINYLHKPNLITDLTKPISWYDGVAVSRDAFCILAYNLYIIYDNQLENFFVGDKWKSRRKLIVNKLYYGKLLSYLELMNESSRILVTRLESLFDEAGVDKHLAIEDTLLQATFRTICMILFGIESDEEYKRFDCDHFIYGVKRYVEIVTDRFKYPWLTIDFLFRLHPSSTEMDHFYQQSMDFIKRLVKDHEETRTRAGKVRKPSLLSDLVAAGLSLEAIYEEISVVVFGGFDTTGKTLNYLLLMLALNPSIQERYHREVDLALENNDCAGAGGGGGQVSAQNLKEMPYLEQCILEILRMFPPLTVFMRELDAPVTLDDNNAIVLPAGTIVTVLPIAVHKNPTYYPNPERFDPERFSAEGRSSRSPFAYVPFSAGPRACLGVKYAMNELLAMAARILNNFEIFTDEKLEEIGFVTSMTIASESPIKILLKKRKSVRVKKENYQKYIHKKYHRFITNNI